MKAKALQYASLTLSGLSLLYLLFVNLWRGDFIFSDWLVVGVDLAVKVIIEFYILMDD